MGNYFELSVANFVMDTGRALPDYTLVPFLASDRISGDDPSSDPPQCYSAEARVIAQRLDLLGFSIAAARAMLPTSLSRLSTQPQLCPPSLAGADSFEQWLEAVRLILDHYRVHDYDAFDELDDERVRFLTAYSEEHILGFPRQSPELGEH